MTSFGFSAYNCEIPIKSIFGFFLSGAPYYLIDKINFSERDILPIKLKYTIKRKQDDLVTTVRFKLKSGKAFGNIEEVVHEKR